MKNRLSLAGGAMAVLGLCGAARADLSWEHTITVRQGKSQAPLVSVKMYNNWSGLRHRLLLKYAVGDMNSVARPAKPLFQSSAFAPTAPVAGNTPVAGSTRYGSLALIHRLDDDRLVAYTSEMRTYISEPLRALLKRTRLDPWKNHAPELSKEPIPSFSIEQRRRLGRELRAAAMPYSRKVWKVYFRPLSQTRTFRNATGSTAGRGYRMTWLINAGGLKSDAEWMRVSCEWWLASEMAGDPIVRQFQQASRATLKSAGWPSASLWFNETMPVLWEAMPQELHEAAQTLIPPPASARAGLGGTPLLMSLTVSPPALQRIAFGGDFRMDITLNRRDLKTLPATVFDAPAGYEKMPLDPQLKRLDDMIDSTTARLERENEAMGLSWQAWHQSSAAIAPLLPLGLRY